MCALISSVEAFIRQVPLFEREENLLVNSLRPSGYLVSSLEEGGALSNRREQVDPCEYFCVCC